MTFNKTKFSLIVLDQNGLSHKDLKPANFLVEWRPTEEPTVQNLKVVLSDFGLVGRTGGTPVYASPEFLDPVVGKSDLFSLGRLFTFMVTEEKSVFYALLFLPVQLQNNQNNIRRIVGQIPILNFILKMTNVLPADRCPLADVDNFLTSVNFIEIISRPLLEARGFPDGPFQVPFSVDEFTRMLQER